MARLPFPSAYHNDQKAFPSISQFSEDLKLMLIHGVALPIRVIRDYPGNIKLTIFVENKLM